MSAFLNTLGRYIPEGQRLLTFAVRGDPTDTPSMRRGMNRPVPWRPGDSLPFDPAWNGYVTVGSFRPAPDGRWLRRGAMFGAGLALLIDDLGPKVPMTALALPPTALVETSPGNFQAWLMLAPPEADPVAFKALIDALAAKVGINDALGITRIGRIPGFINGKPANNGFRCRLVTLEPDRCYSSVEIIEAFDLDLTVGVGRGRGFDVDNTPMETLRARAKLFQDFLKWMVQAGLVKTPPNDAGWIDISCPWAGEHTNPRDDRASIRLPNPENGFSGGFKCHHGHCEGRGWRDLTQWINERSNEDQGHAWDH